MNILLLLISTWLARSPATLPARLEWEPTPERAAERARNEGKLLLVLHLAGEFPDPDLT